MVTLDMFGFSSLGYLI